VPVVKNGAVVPGNVMKVTLSCDHRVVDGATGAAFLQTLKIITGRTGKDDDIISDFGVRIFDFGFKIRIAMGLGSSLFLFLRFVQLRTVSYSFVQFRTAKRRFAEICVFRSVFGVFLWFSG
jgi:hypothetical protein